MPNQKKNEGAKVTYASDFAVQLGFTPMWFTLGVVDAAILTRHREKWDQEEDKNPEHYRYRAFRDFLDSHRPLAPEIASSLFALGAADPDLTMGGAIMADITHLPECPTEILDSAAASGRQHLIRIVQQRRSQKSGS